MRRAWMAGLALAVCCSRKPAPPLPGVDLKGFQPRVRAAVEQAQRDAVAKPQDGAAARRLGMVLQAHSQFELAAACYARADALDPGRFETLRYWAAALASNGDHKGAAEKARAALAIRPGETSAELQLAESLLTLGETQASGEVYGRILARDERNAIAHYGLGRTLAPPGSVTHFRRALELFPRYGAAQFALSAALRQQGDSGGAQAALATYERDKLTVPAIADDLMAALADLSESAVSMVAKGRRLESEGKLEEAAALHRQAVEAEPQMAQAWINLISLNGRLGKFQEAEAAYRKAVELQPSSGEAHYNFGVLCFEQNRMAEARKAFERAVELDPNHAEAANNLGAVLESEGQLARAAELFRRAVALKPSHAKAHFHLGRIYANQRRWPEAIGELEKSLQPESQETPVYLYALAATHGRAGNRGQAVALMQQARARAAAAGLESVVTAIDRDLKVLGGGR